MSNPYRRKLQYRIDHDQGAGFDPRMRQLQQYKINHNIGGYTPSQNRWIEHVKNVAAERGISYGDALRIARHSYR